jgi:hypothetical protein
MSWKVKRKDAADSALSLTGMTKNKLKGILLSKLKCRKKQIQRMRQG